MIRSPHCNILLVNEKYTEVVNFLKKAKNYKKLLYLNKWLFLVDLYIEYGIIKKNNVKRGAKNV